MNENSVLNSAPAGELLSSAPLTFCMPSSMTIETVESLAAELKQLPIDLKTALTLDVSLVDTITTPGLQLIVSLAKTLEAQDGTLTINGVNDAFVHAFRDTGLESLLEKFSSHRRPD